MPILPSEPDCHPANLWENGESLHLKPDGLWWCLHTKPRQEKATARDLREQGVAHRVVGGAENPSELNAVRAFADGLRAAYDLAR